MEGKTLHFDDSSLDLVLTDPHNKRNLVVKGVVKLLLGLRVVDVESLGCDVGPPELAKNFHSLSDKFLADLGNQDLSFCGSNTVILCLFLKNGEDTLNADRDTNGGDVFA